MQYTVYNKEFLTKIEMIEGSRNKIQKKIKVFYS